MRFEELMTVKIHFTVFWVMTPCRLVCGQYFRETRRYLLQPRWHPADDNMRIRMEEFKKRCWEAY